MQMEIGFELFITCQSYGFLLLFVSIRDIAIDLVVVILASITRGQCVLVLGNPTSNVTRPEADVKADRI